jgi:long-chain acyl-CoA synthetase
MTNATITTLADIVRHHGRDLPDQPALEYTHDGRAWTFAQLDADANRVAQALVNDGVGNQDRIAYLDKNAPEYFLYLFGGAKVNAVSVAVNWRLAPPEMEYIINNSEAKTLLIGEEFLDHLAQINLESVTRVIVIGDPGETDYVTFEQWIATCDPIDPEVPAKTDDTCYQLYTSGTTGLPKGVEITHANFIHVLSDGLAVLEIDAASVNLVCMPLFHISGSGWGIIGLYGGSNSILLRDVDLPEILRVIPEKRVTHTIFVPAVLQFLLGVPDIDKTDFSSLKSITYGASPITEAVLVQAMEIFGCDFFQAYGLTETTGAITVLHAKDHDPGGPRADLLRSCGKAIANHQIKIVDAESLETLPDHEVGEIWVRGPQNMKGYWKNPEETRKTLTQDGWLRTGDAGYMIDGFLYIHDRVKDMIISGGENIYPAEIENVLMSHESIADAAVIGVPSDRWGETVKAIIKRTDDDLSEQQVIEYCRAALAGYKCPTSVDWINELPRNPSGKILKTVLREPYWQGKDRRVS